MGEGAGSVKVAVPVGEGLTDGFRFTALEVALGRRTGTAVNVELGAGVNVSVRRGVALAVGESAGICVCVGSAVAVAGTVGEARTTTGAAAGAQAALVDNRKTMIVMMRRSMFTTFLTVTERTQCFSFTTYRIWTSSSCISRQSTREQFMYLCPSQTFFQTHPPQT